MEKIPVSGPSITEKEIAYVTAAVTAAWYGQANVFHQRFEEEFAAYLGVRYAVALPSCTAALHLALAALGIGPGDEVIVPDITWIATAAPITYVGATPVFADIDPRTWCLSAASLESCLTGRTKAVIPVDLYGSVPDMDAMSAIARRHNLAVIEDAAEAIGSEYHGRKAGSLGDVGVFSFHGSKTMTTGEGGMLVTDREDLYQRVLALRDHGRRPGDKMFWNTEVAFKYKMSSMQAALGLAQLERLDELVEHKRRIFSWYRRELSGVAGLTLNYEAPGTKNTYWMVTAIIDPKLGLAKEDLLEQLGEYGIDGRPFFHPLSSLPAYAHLPRARRARQRNQVAYNLSPWGVNLPSGLNMDEEKVAYVCQTLKRLLSLAIIPGYQESCLEEKRAVL
jgi:perosamine synthetase